MTTINGVIFNMKILEPVSTHRNIPNEEPGSDESFITDMGYTGLVLRMTGYEKTLAKYDEVINEFMKPGAHTLVYRTGWQFSVYSTQLVPLLDIGIVDNFFPYELIIITGTPYRESTSETTRPKTITTNNQEWSADNSANDIDTDGSVTAIPDIQITGGAVAATYNRLAGAGHEDTDATVYSQAGQTYVLKKTYTYTAVPSRAWVLETCGLDVRCDNINYTGQAKVTYTAASLNGGAETDVPSGVWSQLGTTWSTGNTVSPDIRAGANENLVIKFYVRCSDFPAASGEMKNLVSTIISRRKDVCKSPQIYNTDDTTVKCDVINEIDPDMTVKINADGTGTLVYADDITTAKYLDAYWDKSGVVYDDANNELDLSNNHFLIYRIDTKSPITGIPIFTSKIDINAGTPKIQISIDNITYYDIDTAIVDNVSTEYPLDNAANLFLKGRTTFYIKLICDGSSTCSLETFSLALDMHTIDVEHPLISSSGVSTFRCDQHANSGLNCVVVLIYRDRSWAA